MPLLLSHHLVFSAWPVACGRLILDQDMIMQCYLEAPYVATYHQTLQNDKEVFFN
jgi:hypothetical protein